MPGSYDRCVMTGDAMRAISLAVQCHLDGDMTCNPVSDKRISQLLLEQASQEYQERFRLAPSAQFYAEREVEPGTEELANVWTLSAAVKVLAARVQALEATIEAMQGGK